MTIIYKRNHAIPRCMLNYWVDNSGEFPGVYVYDINQKRVYKSYSRGSKAFSFAINNDLHIPVVNNRRAVSVERWLSDIEGTLNNFLILAHNHSPITNLNSTEEMKLVLALYSLAYRSRYKLNAIEIHVINREYADKTDAKQFTLENLIFQVITNTRKSIPVEMILGYAGDDSWLLCDRPFIDRSIVGYHIVILTNKMFVAFRKSQTSYYRYTYLDAPSVTEMNRMIVYYARDWIIADSIERLQKYISVFNEPEWQTAREKDKVKEITLPEPVDGWKITD